MKKLAFILLFFPFIGFGQDINLDKLIFSNGDSIYGKVIEIGLDNITYQYKNESANNIAKKTEIAKIIYSSGRIEIFEGQKKLETKVERDEYRKRQLALTMERQKRQLLLRKEEKKNEIGFVIGPNWSRRDRDLIPTEWSLAVSGGISFKYHFPGIFSISTGAFYERKNSENHVSYTDVIGNVIGVGILKQSFDYLTIPILFPLSFGKKTKFFLNSGLSFSYIMNTVLAELSYGDELVLYNNDIRDFYSFGERLDLGYVVGTGCVFLVTDKLSANIEIRYTGGLSEYLHGKNQSANLLLGMSYKY